MDTTPIFPDPVREGDVLSADWLNRSLDCLKALAKSGASSSSSASSSIRYTAGPGRDTKARPYNEEDMPTFIHRDFELRILRRDDAADPLPPLVQVHDGRVLDYRGACVHLVSEGSGCTPDCWVDVAPLPTEGELSVYLLISRTATGAVSGLRISTVPEADVPPDPVLPESVSSGAEALSCISVGKVSSAVINDLRRFYIEQSHIGPVALQAPEVARLASNSSALSLFRNRIHNTFFFKGLRAEEGISLSDGTEAISCSLVPASSGTLGGIRGVQVEYLPAEGSYASNLSNFLRDGVLYLSIPTIAGGGNEGSKSGESGNTGGGDSTGCSCPSYEFDTTYFTLEARNASTFVSLNTAAIEGLVQECAQEIAVEVNVSGLLEQTAFGSLRVSTGGGGSLDNLQANSVVSY